MNTTVLPILEGVMVRPLIRPDFTPTTGIAAKTWVLLNLQDLYDWYLATQTGESDWLEYCDLQFGVQQNVDEELEAEQALLKTAESLS